LSIDRNTHHSQQKTHNPRTHHDTLPNFASACIVHRAWDARRARLETLHGKECVRAAKLHIEGRTQNKPFKASFNVGLRQALHMKAALFAEEHDLKLNAVINDALQEYLEKAV